MSCRLKLIGQVEKSVTGCQLSRFLAGKKAVWHDTLEGILISINEISPAATQELMDYCNAETPDLRLALRDMLER